MLVGSFLDGPNGTILSGTSSFSDAPPWVRPRFESIDNPGETLLSALGWMNISVSCDVVDLVDEKDDWGLNVSGVWISGSGGAESWVKIEIQ